MESLFFIVNPIAGSGHAAKRFAEVESALCERGISYSFKFTERKGHAFELAKNAYDEGKRRIVSVGGDGTAREVGSALAGTDAVLGFLPFGTGNDLSRPLGIPSDVRGALDVLLNGSVKAMDVGLANNEIFLNVSGFGFDVDVIRYTEKYKTRLNGMLPYMLGIIKALFLGMKGILITIKHDGESYTCNSLLIAIGNGTHFGGGMNVTPNADPFDGLFDVCVIRKVGKLRFLSLLSWFVKGKHIKKTSIVSVFRTDDIMISTNINYPLNLDGDLGTGTPVHYRLLRSALNILVPAEVNA